MRKRRKVWRIRFDANGDPHEPEVVRAGLEPGFLDAANLDRDGSIDADDRTLWLQGPL